MKKTMQNIGQLLLSALLLTYVGLNDLVAQTTSYGVGAGTGGTGAYFGKDAGKVSSGELNAFFGNNSGYSNTTGEENTFIGDRTGYANTSGLQNTFVGSGSGAINTTGRANTFLGNLSGMNNTSGDNGVFLGSLAGYSNTTGISNIFIGAQSGRYNTTGLRNTIIGAAAGESNLTGSLNVFLGYRAGSKELGSNKLYIANDSTSKPLIYGDFSSSKLVFNGKVGVGTSTFPSTVGGVDVSSYKLFVKGGILTDEIRVRTGWADYVFHKDYNLRSLSTLEDYIRKMGHLPNVPSANEVESQGLNIGDIAKIQQEKIEELTLYAIDQEKKIKKQDRKLEMLDKELQELKDLVRRLDGKN